ncbi:MAG TPA: flagellar assembly protein FliW [Verrucomicrobiae bacterium]|jgi:flagellar assembly factor FliW|nr:flagellar assembly protein FliW [Verrucomicrobiae bacterium]
MDVEKHEAAKAPSAGENPALELFFPEGLFGFATPRYFTLNPYLPPDGSPSPFFLLQSNEDDLCFPLISPELLILEYKPEPPAELLAKLGAGSQAELAAFAIVTLRERVEEITVNLQGPILLNPRSRLGLQFVVEQYPLRCPLLTAPQA